MSPADFQRDVVTARLRTISQVLSEIGDEIPVDATALRSRPLLRLALERAFIQVVDLAVDTRRTPHASRPRRKPESGNRPTPSHRHRPPVDACNRFTGDFADYVRQAAAFTP